MLLGYYSGVGRFQPAGFSVAGSAGQPARVQFQVLRPVRPGRLEGELPAHAEPGPALGLSQRALRNATTAWAGGTSTTPSAACWLPTRRSSTAASSATQLLQVAGRRNPRTRSKNVFAPRLGFAFRPFGDAKTVVRGGYGVFWDSAEGREIDGAADIYPYVSRGNYIQTAGQTDAAEDDEHVCSPALPTSARRRLPPTRSSRSACRRSRKNPYVQQWSVGVQREIIREHDRSK